MFDCSNNPLSNPDFSLLPGLYELYCLSLDLKKLDVSSHVNLEALYVSGNPLEMLNLGTLNDVSVELTLAQGKTLTVNSTAADWVSDASDIVSVAGSVLTGQADEGTALITSAATWNMLHVTAIEGDPAPTPTGRSSSSNCNGGVGAAFFALAGLFLVGKKKR